MSRIRNTLLLLATLALSTYAATPADQTFPDTTKGFFSIKNLKEFSEQWEKTQIGRLANDPLMDNFKKEVQKQLSERMENTFGLTFDGISTLPSGEVAFGMIAIPSQIPGYVLTMDVAGKRPETNEYLSKLTQKLVAAGVKKSTETYKEQQITVLTFPPPDAPPALPGIKIEITLEPIERKAYYMFVQDVLVASDRLHLLQLIADRLAGQNTAQPLAEVESYQAVMKRCIGDMPSGTSPIIRWYIEPLDYGESVRIVLQNRSPALQNRRDRPSIFSILKQQGFDALRGIGGVISIKAEAQETVYRTFIYTKKPYRQAMQMLNFPDSTNFTPPAWMPGDLARCTMFYVDPVAIFDNFDALFDAIIMPGDKGVWRDILDGLEKDPHGPQINIRNELIVNLGNRVLGMSRYEKPITINSESIVVAVELKQGRESAMLAGIEKLFGTDPEMMSTEYKSYKIWHRKPAEDVITPYQDLDIPDLFGSEPSTGGSAGGVVQVSAVVPQQSGANEDRPPMFPEGGIVVAKGCLFVSTNIEYLKMVLDRLEVPSGSSISGEAEYQLVDRIFSGFGLTDKPHFFQFFSRTHETLRPTYEMVRLDRMAQSQTLFAKILNEVLSAENESGIRRQIIEGSSLPEFEKVERYFGMVGIYGVSEENGYFIKGFTLER